MPKSYPFFSLEEWIADDEFIRWVKYPTAESDRFWERYLDDHPEQAETIRKARLAVEQLVLASRQEHPADDVPHIWSVIDEDLAPARRLVFGRYRWQWAAAASVLLLLVGGLGWYVYQKMAGRNMYEQLTARQDGPLKEVVTTASETRTVWLPDSSRVVLEPNTRLSFDDRFAGPVRAVYLSGEAFFDVRKNPRKPFMVYANELVTKVLGTSFRVDAREQGANPSVDVRSGKVSVFANSDGQLATTGSNIVVLAPNQKVVFLKEEARLVKTLVENPQVINKVSEANLFTFQNKPAAEIFQALEKAYGIEIVFDKDLMANCVLTTSLADETLFEKLDIICAGIEATYKVTDTQIVIDSKGCD